MGLFDRIKGALGMGSSDASDPASEAPQQEVHIDEVLAAEAAKHGMTGLNYETSIVDLLKVLGLPSDGKARHDLGQELGVEANPGDSAAYNTELHAKVIEALEASGGKIPDSWR